MEDFSHIRGIFFDLGLTLYGPANGNWNITDKLYELCGTEWKNKVTDRELESALAECFRYMNAHHKLHTRQEEEAQFTRFYRILSKNLPALTISDEQAAFIAHDRVYNMENYRLFSGALRTVQELHRRGYTLGVISDTWPSVTQQLEHMGLLPYFTTLTFSCELGVFKPDPAMYRDALSKMNIPAENTVFIDDLPGNLAGARKAGMHGILSVAGTPEQQPQNPAAPEAAATGASSACPAITAIHTVPDLLELFPAL